ncbi:MAG: methyltransferase domain-containing protein [Gemmatimonadota bacterium]
MNLSDTLSTDPARAWEHFARTKPFHAVYEPYERECGNVDAFFSTGEQHVATVLRVRPDWTPASVLDFGCGVGRMLRAFSDRASRVVGVDASPTMRAAARRLCPGTEICGSLDEVEGTYDLIHSYTVFQHIPVRAGMELIARLSQMVNPGGLMLLHVTYGRDCPPIRNIVHRLRATVPGVNAVVNLLQSRPVSEPMMQMNRYSLLALHDLLGSVRYAFRTQHGEHLGVIIAVDS